MPFFKRTSLLVGVFCSIFLAFFGCSPTKNTPSSKKPLVLVSIAPYLSILEAITQGDVELKCLVPPTYDIHTFELTAKQLMGVKNASLWVGIDEPLERNLLPILRRETPSLRYLNLYASLEEKIQGDRHIWMSATSLKEQVPHIVKALTHLFPEKSSLYRTRAKTLQDKLTSLHLHLKALLTPYQGKEILTAHPALTYFCRDYALTEIALEKEGKPLKAGDLTSLYQKLDRKNIVCIFTQSQHPHRGTEFFTEHLSVPSYPIDPYREDVMENLTFIGECIAHP